LRKERTPGTGGVGAVRPADGQPLAKPRQAILQPFADAAAHGRARVMDRIRIHVASDLLCDVGFARQSEHERGKGWVAFRILLDEGEQGRGQRAHVRIQIVRALGKSHEEAHGNRLRGLPAVEGVRIVTQEPEEVLVREIERHLHGCREATEHGWHGLGGDVGEGEAVGGLVEHEESLALDAVAPCRQRAPVPSHEAEHDREHHRLLRGLAGRW
jgi:hypothetical protein